MKQLILLMLLWQSYLTPAAGVKRSPLGLKNGFDTIINNKDKKSAIRLFAGHQLLVAADMNYFSDKQKQYLAKLHAHFIDQIEATFHLSEEQIQACLLEARKQEISSLITAIEKNQMHVSWSEYIGKFAHKPSENEVIKHRIEFLKKLKEYYEQEG